MCIFAHTPLLSSFGWLHASCRCSWPRWYCFIDGFFSSVGAAPSSDSSARDPMDVIGDWITLGPRQWGEAHAWWDKPITGEVDLILATSIARGEPSDTCWALFRAFRLHTSG